jgi:hypothetical protein
MNKFDTYVSQNRLDLVRGTMVFEDCVFSRNQTEKILSNEVVPNLDYKLVCGVRNVNRAWSWVCSPKEYGLGVLEELHAIVSEDVIRVPWLEGTFRDETVGVRISSSTYVPPLTTRSEAYNEFEKELSYVLYELKGYQSIEYKVKVCLSLFVFLMKRQYFIDANKRTAYLFVNSLLRDFGIGKILLLPNLKNYENFNKLLKKYYEGGQTNKLKLINYLNRYYIKDIR